VLRALDHAAQEGEDTTARVAPERASLGRAETAPACSFQVAEQEEAETEERAALAAEEMGEAERGPS
jgi:hypothetical protein